MKSLSPLLPVVALIAANLPACKDANKGKDERTAKPAVPLPSHQSSPEEPVAVPSPAPEPGQPTLVRAQPLPQVALASLRKRMQNHGDDTENLLWATLMLDYESAEGIAGIISAAPTLARPLKGDLDTINAMLPTEFFDLQDRLTAAVDGLRDAAKAKNDAAIAVQYGQVVQTCISCHSLFLQFPTPE